MKMPTFLVKIGVGQAGTSSLARYFKQHPQIYVSPPKEPNFFGCGRVNSGFSGTMWGNSHKCLVKLRV